MKLNQKAKDMLLGAFVAAVVSICSWILIIKYIFHFIKK